MKRVKMTSSLVVEKEMHYMAAEVAVPILKEWPEYNLGPRRYLTNIRLKYWVDQDSDMGIKGEDGNFPEVKKYRNLWLLEYSSDQDVTNYNARKALDYIHFYYAIYLGL